MGGEIVGIAFVQQLEQVVDDAQRGLDGVDAGTWSDREAQRKVPSVAAADKFTSPRVQPSVRGESTV